MRRTLMALLVVAVLFTAASAFAGDCGDANNSGTINALDITYLINFLYKHGPAPTCDYAVKDIDGNVYKTVKIGDQWWMAENLKVTHYRNGDAIPDVTDGVTWAGLTTGAYCEYNNDINNVATYGRLYNWHAVNDSRNIAPAGWHVANDAEWQTLVDYLGADAGGKMKEEGTTHWTSPNTGATNESGFTALPGGWRGNDGIYYSRGGSAVFWSSTEGISLGAWCRHLYSNDSIVHRDEYYKQGGLSIRCVKD